MKTHDGILLRIAASTRQPLRIISGCVLVLAVSVANASNVGALPVPPRPAAIVDGAPAIPLPGDSVIVAMAAPNSGAILCALPADRSLFAKQSTTRRLALGVNDPPSRQLLKTARLQLPRLPYIALRPSCAALGDSFISAANRQRAP